MVEKELAKQGISVEYALTVKDELNAIKQALKDTWGKYCGTMAE